MLLDVRFLNLIGTVSCAGLPTWCGVLQVSGLRQVAVASEAEALALFFEVGEGV